VNFLKSLPQRTCIGCNTTKNKQDLIRIVKNKEGEIFLDRTGKANGRGAYLCDNIECLEKAMKTKKLARALDSKAIEEKIYEELRGVMLGK